MSTFTMFDKYVFCVGQLLTVVAIKLLLLFFIYKLLSFSYR